LWELHFELLDSNAWQPTLLHSFWRFKEELKTRALKLKVTTGIEPVADLGPVIIASSPRSALAVLMSLVLDGC